MTLLERKHAMHPLSLNCFLLLNSFHRALRSEPSPKKSEPGSRNLNQKDIDIVRKLVASLENHLRSKNQLQAQVENELKRVKEVVKLDPTLRIFVKRIGISVSLKVIKVI